MFRGGGGGGQNGNGSNAHPPAAASSSSSSPANTPPVSSSPLAAASSSSAATTMMNFARSIGLGGGKPSNQPSAPPPADLPNPQTPNHQADTNSVFYIDDTLSELARVRRYALSQLPLQRLVYVKRIGACARAVGLNDTLTQILPLFQKLIADQEAVVRTAAATELANISHYLADPNLPWIPVPATNNNLPSTSKPPTSAQSPDVTLEDDQILDLEVADIDNALPDRIPSAASASASAANAESSSQNSDAMDVDDSVATTPIVGTPVPKSVDLDVDSPMEDVHESVEDHEPSAAEASAAAAVVAEEKKQQQEQKVDESTSAAITAAVAVHQPASSPPLAAAPTLTITPSSPLSLSSASSSSSSFPLIALPHLSPIHDPTSITRVEAYESIKEIVIPCLQTLILDNNAEVRAAACDSLVRVADVLRGDDVGKVVLTLVLNLAHDERDEQRTTAVHLMHELAPRLGHDLCRSFVALELAAFADDATFRVRKATAQSFGNVCHMVGEAFTVTKLLPCYVRLSNDLIWGVRKGCVESLVAVTKVVSLQTRTEVLIPMFERFAKDSSRWVRNGAYEILGPFLHALGPELASKELVAYYTNIPNMSTIVVDPEVHYHAAFNLPAVITTIGRDRWTDELLPCFNALAKDPKFPFPVRRTLAYSLHELAHLLGPQLTEASLLPALDAFLRDLDEVRYGVLKNFARILKEITPAKRVVYLEVLWMVQKQQSNWRWRLLWAKQLGVFTKLFSAEQTVTDIRPLAFALCRDQVASVRRTAAKALGRLILRFLGFNSSPASTAVVTQCLNDIYEFASSKTFMDRQLYLRMLEGFIGILPNDLFEETLARAVPLASDKTSNVRLSCVVTLRTLMSHTQFQASPSAQHIIRTLMADTHKDVRARMQEAMGTIATSSLATSLSSLTLAPSTSSASTTASASSSTNSQSLTDDDLTDILSGPSSTNANASSSSSSSSSASSSALPPSSDSPHSAPQKSLSPAPIPSFHADDEPQQSQQQNDSNGLNEEHHEEENASVDESHE